MRDGKIHCETCRFELHRDEPALHESFAAVSFLPPSFFLSRSRATPCWLRIGEGDRPTRCIWGVRSRSATFGPALLLTRRTNCRLAVVSLQLPRRRRHRSSQLRRLSTAGTVAHVRVIDTRSGLDTSRSPGGVARAVLRPLSCRKLTRQPSEGRVLLAALEHGVELFGTGCRTRHGTRTTGWRGRRWGRRGRSAAAQRRTQQRRSR